jgi:integrase
VAILTPDELAAILTYAREEIIPWIAFRAFSTIRDSELKILDWEQVKPKSIRITKGKGLVPTRRLIPIAPNLKEWIEPFRLKSGQVSPFANSYKQFKKACDAAGVKYSRNCLRHSAITYRVMLTGNVERIALESGNSAAKIHSNYL